MQFTKNLEKRLKQKGGIKQQDRMKRDKLETLKRALHYSYQGQTAILGDGREFRCLINEDNLKVDHDDKMISIPFADRRANAKSHDLVEDEEIGMKMGDVFKWKETDSYWIVFKKELAESAYFRGYIRRCDYELEFPSGNKQRVYVRGPVETKIDWRQKKKLAWNSLNHSVLMYITKTQEALDFFDRFKKFRLGGKLWETQTVDSFGEGIIEITGLEAPENKFEPDQGFQPPPLSDPPTSPTEPHIEGAARVEVYSKNIYNVVGVSGGEWKLDSDKAVLKDIEDTRVTVQILTGRSARIPLSYHTATTVLKFEIEVMSI